MKSTNQSNYNQDQKSIDSAALLSPSVKNEVNLGDQDSLISNLGSFECTSNSTCIVRLETEDEGECKNDDYCNKEDISIEESNGDLTSVSVIKSSSSCSIGNRNDSVQSGGGEQCDEVDEDEEVRQAREIALNASKLAAISREINITNLTPEELKLLTQPDQKQRQLIEEASFAAGLHNNNNNIVPLAERIGIGKAKEKFEAFKDQLLAAGTGAAIDASTSNEEEEIRCAVRAEDQPGGIPVGPETALKKSQSQPTSLEMSGDSQGHAPNSNEVLSEQSSTLGKSIPSLKLQLPFTPAVPMTTIPKLSSTDNNASALDTIVRTKLLQTTPTLSSIVWKQRSGYGKYSIRNAWEKRRLELVGSKLYYYKCLDKPLPSSSNENSTSSQEPTTASSSIATATTAVETTATTTATAKPQFKSSSPLISPSVTSSSLPHPQEPLTKKKDLRQLWEQASAHIINKAQENLSKLDPNHHYHNESNNENHLNDPSSSLHPNQLNEPRGRLDLIEESATAAALSDGHLLPSGSKDNNNSLMSGIMMMKQQQQFQQLTQQLTTLPPPTPFGLIICVKSGVEIKWKICFESQRQQMMWLAAITDVIVQRSVNCYNENLLCGGVKAKNVSGSSNNKGDLVTEEAGIGGNTLCSPPPGKDGLWKRDFCMIRVLKGYDCNAENGDGEGGTLMVEEKALNCVSESSIMSAARNKLYCACILFNASLFLVRLSSTSAEVFWFVIILVNAVTCILLGDSGDCYNNENKSNNGIQSRQTSVLIKKDRKNNRNGGDTLNEKSCILKNNSFKPTAGSTSVLLHDPKYIPVINGHRFLGWMPLKCDEMKVRSYGYLKTKKKISTPKPLYRVVSMDAISSNLRIPRIATRIKPPDVIFDDGGIEKTWCSPDIFVVSLSIPTENPTLGRPQDDGFGYTIIIYYVMTEKTREILRRITAPGYNPLTDNMEADVDAQSRITNSVRLWEEWCRKAPTDPNFFNRFKLIPNIHNLSEVGLPSYMVKYCGKPLLIKRQGVTGFISFHPKLNAMEFEVNLHPFPYLLKKATAYLKEQLFSKVIVSFTYVIEGRSDNELPEAVIGEGIKLFYPEPNSAVHADDFFSGKTPSQSEDEAKKQENGATLG